MNLRDAFGRVARPCPSTGAAPAGPDASSRRALTLLAALAVLGAACGWMHPAGADLLSGTVRDSSGAPVNNADFDVFDLDGDKLPFDGSTRTTGRYELQVDPGRYDVVCQPPVGTGLAPQARRGVQVGGDTRLDWILPPAARVLGRVTGPDGRLLARAQLDFDRTADGSRQPVLGDLTNIFGSFAVYVESGEYRVTAHPSATDTLLAPTRIAAVRVPTTDTLHLVLPPAVHLTGTVRGPDGAGVPNARLVFERSPTRERVPAWGHVAGPDGAFRSGIEAGTYRVTVEPPRGLLLPALRLDGVDLTADRGLDFTLERGVLLSGRVLGPEGAPLVGADWDVVDESTDAGVPTPFDNVDEEGRYSLALPAGIYRLQLSPPAGFGLDTLVFRNVAVMRDTVLDVSYGHPAAPGSPLRLAPLGNPTHRRADLRLWLPAAAQVRIDVFDVSGRRVRRLEDGLLSAGPTDIHWDGNDASGAPANTGVYFVRAEAPTAQVVTRLVMLP